MLYLSATLSNEEQPIKRNGTPLKGVTEFNTWGLRVTAILKDDVDLELAVRSNNYVEPQVCKCINNEKIDLRAFCQSILAPRRPVQRRIQRNANC